MAIYQRGNRWHVDVYDSNGKRIRKPARIKGVHPDEITKKQALAYEKILKGKYAEGEFELPGTRKDLSFEKVVSRYLDWCDSNHERADRDHTACKNLLEYFKGRKASKINLWLIEGYKKHRKGQGREPRTINIELSAFRLMYNKAVEWGLLNKNPITGMKLLKEEVKEIRVIDESELKRLYQNANEYFKPVLLFAYFTGCRSSEIRLLKWENVNLKEGSVLITKTKNREERTVYLTGLLVSELQKLNKTREKLKREDRSDYVFTYKEYPYFTKSNLGRSWNRAVAKSGIKHCRFHDLRHTFCSNLMVNEGVDFETVMSLSGHKSLSMLKRYTHTNKNAKKDAVKRLEKYMKIENNSHNLVTNVESTLSEESQGSALTS